MNINQTANTPAPKLYIPLLIALLPSLAMAYLRTLEVDCLAAGMDECGVYKFEFKLTFFAILIGLMVSVFAFRRTIIVAVALLTIAWNLIFSAVLTLPFLSTSNSNLFFVVFFILPLIAPAGIAIKRCLRPHSN